MLLYNHSETKITAHFVCSTEDGMLFKEGKNEILIDPRNVEYIINFGTYDLPPAYYREKKVFIKTQN